MTQAQSNQRDRVEPLTIAVCADPAKDDSLLRAAARLSVDLQLPFLEKPKKRGVDVLLVAAPGRLELRMVGGDPSTRGGRAVCVDLCKLDVTSPAGRRLRQPIARAVGLKTLKDAPPTVIDATAGWGEDAWLAAALGCRVLAVERNKVVATLLRDGLLRATAEHPDIGARITLIQTNALHLLQRLARSDKPQRHDDLPAAMAGFWRPDVVYLDPMFPPRRKGAEAKPMKVLRQLVGDDADAPRLWQAAMRIARRRVVVKRPLHADPITDDKPTTRHKGKSLRYDVYAVG